MHIDDLQVREWLQTRMEPAENRIELHPEVQRRILQRLSDLDEAAAGELLTACDGELKTAILVARLGIDVTDARQRLATVGGRLRAALGDDA